MRSSDPLLLLALSFTAMSAGCSEGDVRAHDLVVQAESEVEGLDLTELSVDDMQATFVELTIGIVYKLWEVKDPTSALVVRDEIEPILEKLGPLKDALGDQAPSLDSLSTAVEQLEARFGAREDILSVLRPVLDRIQALGS